MRELSEQTAALLKSRTMVGEDKFNLSIRLEGVDYYTDVLETKMTLVSSGKFADYAIRSDGKVLYVYQVGVVLYRKFIDSEEAMMSVENSGNSGEAFLTLDGDGVVPVFSLLRLKSGKILLFVADRGVKNSIPYSIKCYESASGLGTDFTLLSTMYTFMRTLGEGGYDKASIGKAYELADGSIMVLATGSMYNLSGFDASKPCIYKSTDKGANWTSVVAYSPDSDIIRLSGYYSFIELNGLLFATEYFTAIDYYAVCYWSADGGVTWGRNYLTFFPAGMGGSVRACAFARDTAGNLFASVINDADYNLSSIYKMTNIPNPLTFADLNNSANWQKLFTTTIGAKGLERDGFLTVSPKGNLHWLQSHFGTLMYDFALIRDEYSALLEPSSLTISKGRGGANTMNLTLDNTDGSMNPRNPSGSLYGVIGLNKQIIVKQGYGTDLIETFTGHIDSFQMSSFPHIMQISCRDALKKALDQTITEAGSHTVAFDAQPIETIFGYLCYLAGIETGEIQATGISISKEFSWQTYADAFQFLADLASFEFGADEYGKVYFRRDFQPDAISIAYTFEEGVDITSLKYEMSDNDLYRTVKVYGKSGDTVLAYSAPFLDAAKYNILPQKVLKVDATEATTMAELQKIADRSIYLMNSRTAVVDFSAVAVPWLQVGDFIQVVERSSMSAGIYRISSLSLQMTDKEFTMDLQCYYYGDSIDIGTLPDDTATQAADPTLNLIPEMTSNTEPSGVCRASSVATLQYNNYEPWNAFNSSSEDWFWNALTTYGWIEYQFTEKTIVDRYMLKARQALSYNDGMPKNWTFEAFDGEKWIVLDARTNQTAWQIYEERFYDFTNTAAYSRYRLNVTANNGENRLQLEQLAMYYRGGV